EQLTGNGSTLTVLHPHVAISAHRGSVQERAGSAQIMEDIAASATRVQTDLRQVNQPAVVSKWSSANSSQQTFSRSENHSQVAEQAALAPARAPGSSGVVIRSRE